MEIGGLKINNPVFLAPMAGVTDYPFRQIVRQMGCELVYTEMVSSKGIVYDNSRTEELIDFSMTGGGKIGVQLFGEDPEYMAKAARIVAEKFQVDLIDINMGCPTPKIVKNGAGAALMKDLDLAAEITRQVVEAVRIPVTVKMRKGWDDDHINAVNIAKIVEKNGARAVAVHGRTRKEFYTGKADWEIIKKVKDSISIPVIGNGDVFTPEQAEELINLTGCDAVMVGRGAQGNPWLIKRIIYYLRKGQLLPEPGYEEVIKMAVYHLEEAVRYYGEDKGIPRMRKHLSWYMKGMPRSTVIKNKINTMTELKEIKELLNDYLIMLKTKSSSE